jgi:hypothetical protein
VCPRCDTNRAEVGELGSSKLQSAVKEDLEPLTSNSCGQMNPQFFAGALGSLQESLLILLISGLFGLVGQQPLHQPRYDSRSHRLALIALLSLLQGC